MKIALLQTDPVFGKIDENLEAVERRLTPGRADVWLLPELFATGYLFTSRAEVEAVAEPLEGGATVTRLLRWARELDAAVCGGFVERDGELLYNSAVIAGPDGLLSHYRKIHVFDRERMFFAIGDRPFEVVEFRGTRLGLMICFDWRLPEPTQSLAFLGADLVLHPSNLVLPWCPDAMVTRALENAVYVATCDRCGVEERGGVRLRFIGRSQVVAPDGERLGSLGPQPGVLEVELDPTRARDKQVTPHNHLYRDRVDVLYVQEPVHRGDGD